MVATVHDTTGYAHLRAGLLHVLTQARLKGRQVNVQVCRLPELWFRATELAPAHEPTTVSLTDSEILNFWV